jgi:L-threonylcarbamoyladenylate synthase
MNPTRLQQAVALLQAGGLVAFPTETVYGLGADAANPEAVAGVFAAKGRPADHPLIVHLADAGHLAQWAEAIPQTAWALAAAFWPGPLTLILKKQAWVPLAVTGGQDTIGLRVPAHPLARELLRAFATARAPMPAGIAAPSANRFGRISPTTAAHVHEELGDRVSLILDGGSCEVGIESTIVDLSRVAPEILRPGAISAEEIARVIGVSPLSHLREAGQGQGGRAQGPPLRDAPRVSGSLAAHYAPRTALRLVEASALPVEAVRLAQSGQRVAVLAHSVVDPGDARLSWQSLNPDPAVYAHDLYASLRAMDALGMDALLVESVPASSSWRAIADRLGRAAAGAALCSSVSDSSDLH